MPDYRTRLIIQVFSQGKSLIVLHPFVFFLPSSFLPPIVQCIRSANGVWDMKSCDDQTIVLIEDDDGDALVTETVFAQHMPHMSLKRLKSYTAAEAYFSRIKRKKEQVPPACVLLDLRLGDGDGEALLDQMVDHPLIKDSAVIILSGDSTNPYRDLDRPGVAARMEKPRSIAAYKRLLQTITLLMSAKNQDDVCDEHLKPVTISAA